MAIVSAVYYAHHHVHHARQGGCFDLPSIVVDESAAITFSRLCYIGTNQSSMARPPAGIAGEDVVVGKADDAWDETAFIEVRMQRKGAEAEAESLAGRVEVENHQGRNQRRPGRHEPSFSRLL